MKEFDRSPLGAQKGTPSTSAGGAQVQGGPSAVSRVTADARRLQSGLKKTELMQERSRDLLKNMLKQDAEPVPVPLPPW